MVKNWEPQERFKWFKYLQSCHEKQNYNSLVMTMREIQKGMDDLTKIKLNNIEMNLFFTERVKQLEKTGWAIWLSKNPKPKLPEDLKKWKEIKKKAREEMNNFFRMRSY